jgi:hypothetical protein
MICPRCGEKTNVHIMSMYNTQEICMKCKDAEEKRPDYAKAREADEVAIRSGNFKGIGFDYDEK